MNFHPLEVVDRVSETQLQVGENLQILIYQNLAHMVFIRVKIIIVQTEATSCVNDEHVILVSECFSEYLLVSRQYYPVVQDAKYWDLRGLVKI